jgi:hypothetical protein
MKDRCQNPNSNNWEAYGARGVTVCERWQSFENFLADMGERPEGKTLDRYPDRNGGYGPDNCRWATPLEQRHHSSESDAARARKSADSRRGKVKRPDNAARNRARAREMND